MAAGDDAAQRRNVYKERPVHEQRDWTEQIRRGSILEIIDLHEGRIQRLVDRAVKHRSVGDAVGSLVRALLRWPKRAKCRRNPTSSLSRN